MCPAVSSTVFVTLASVCSQASKYQNRMVGISSQLGLFDSGVSSLYSLLSWSVEGEVAGPVSTS